MSDRVGKVQCPNCSGPLIFSAKEQKLLCEYCGSSFTQAEIDALNQEDKEKIVQNQAEFEIKASKWSEDEQKMFNIFTCSSCSAEVMADDTTIVTTCPYCGNSAIIESRFHGDLCPKYVLPFKLEKDDAIKQVKKTFKNKLLLSKDFSKDSHIEEIKGIYVPFFLYDANIFATIQYEGLKESSHRSGDYIITTTEHYDILRSGSLIYERVPADASTSMDDAYMDAIEPYNYDDLVDFSSSYMAGYMADLYDVTIEENKDRAYSRMKQSTIDRFEETIFGYTSVNEVNTSLITNEGQSIYVYLPVWLLVTQYKDKAFLFAINGQTGKAVGELPVDRGRFTLFAILIFVVLSIFIVIGLVV